MISSMSASGAAGAPLRTLALEDEAAAPKATPAPEAAVGMLGVPG